MIFINNNLKPGEYFYFNRRIWLYLLSELVYDLSYFLFPATSFLQTGLSTES